jgi:lipopolysaccharide transport system ATP-binding protein
MKDAIVVQGLGKRFSRYHSHKPRTIMEAALAGWRHINPKEYFWALQGISFRLSPGEMLGIIGKNGAGKSTLLRLIGGVGKPDLGKLRVNGRIGALLDLGAGLHPDLTGRENIFVCGVVAGLLRREVAQRFESIVEFAELWQSIDSPTRTYSSGMKLRLAFAIAIHTEPQVLLVDEFLSVGDEAFQAKCLEKISQLKSQGTAIILISHNHEQIKTMCDRAFWLRQGKIAADGAPAWVVEQYLTKFADDQISTRR